MNPAKRLLYRLALASGYFIYNPYALARRMPHRVLREWVDYFQVEPFGEERADLRAAMIAMVTANVHRGKKTSPYKLTDFMPKFGEEAERQRLTPQQLSTKVFWINRLLGGSYINKRQGTLPTESSESEA